MSFSATSATCCLYGFLAEQACENHLGYQSCDADAGEFASLKHQLSPQLIELHEDCHWQDKSFSS